DTPIRIPELALLVLLSVATFYTRTIGLALVAGISLWLWKRYNRSAALIYGSLCILLCLPWLWWTLMQPESIEKIGAFYLVPQNQSYVTEFFTAIIKYQGIMPIVFSAAAL